METSDDVPWGRTVRIKKGAVKGFGDQPVGAACATHYCFHNQYLSWMPFSDFANAYHDSDDFQAAVNEGVAAMKQMEDPETDAEPADTEFAKERVCDNDQHFLDIKGPKAVMLTHTQYLRQFGVDPKKDKVKYITIPSVDGSSPGALDYYLADIDGQLPYPTVRVVNTIGADRLHFVAR